MDYDKGTTPVCLRLTNRLAEISREFRVSLMSSGRPEADRSTSRWRRYHAERGLGASQTTRIGGAPSSNRKDALRRVGLTTNTRSRADMA
jgi:hypothetical protein